MNLQSLARSVLFLPLVVGFACTSANPPAAVAQVAPINLPIDNDTNPPMTAKPAGGTLGSVERLDPALDALLPTDAKVEILIEGVDWAEGPVWWDGGLHFSDVKQNTNYRWTAKDGVHPYLKPSGYTATTPRGGEPGSNGMTLDHQNRLVMCQHGDRRVARLEKDGKTLTLIAERYQGKRFNSPNDLCYHSNGNLYFTDPPYGLEKQNADPKKEMDVNGVYLVRPTGEIVRLAVQLNFPNGIALSPDEKTLYVDQSDPKNPVIMKYDVQADGTVTNGRVLFDASALAAKKLLGLPDGMKVDIHGNLWATGPGGVLILSPEGKHLGTLATGVPTANCAWGDDGSTLYITANHNVCRIKTRTKGKMPGAG